MEEINQMGVQADKFFKAADDTIAKLKASEAILTAIRDGLKEDECEGDCEYGHCEDCDVNALSEGFDAYKRAKYGEGK